MAETLATVTVKRRTELQITQRELARKLGISNSTISRIESADKEDPEVRITPDNKTLRKMSEVLNIDYNYLLALNGQVDDQLEIRIIQRAAKKMNEEQLQDMIAMLKIQFKDAFKDVDSDFFDTAE